MSVLPYIQTNREISLNAGLLLIILDCLAVTKREKRVLTLDKAQVFYYLILRPVILNKVLAAAGKREVAMGESEYYTVDSISLNVDPLFDRNKIKLLFRYLASRKLVDITYNNKDGFLFELNKLGKEKSEYLTGDYFSVFRRYANQLVLLQSTSIGKLNAYLNLVLKQVV